MPQNKRFCFPLEDQGVSLFAQALCHPARLEIIRLLNRLPFLLCQQVAEELPLARPTVSQHLAELEKVGIVRKAVQFGLVGYELHPQGWPEAKEQLLHFLRQN